MSNNLILHSDYIFKTLIKYSGEDVKSSSKMRIFKEDGYKNQLTFFKSIKVVEHQKFLHDLIIGSFSAVDGIYFYATGLTETDLNETGLVDTVEFRSEIFIFLAKHLELKINNAYHKDELIENIVFQQDDQNYEGHLAFELNKYFSDYVVFRIPTNSSLQTSDFFSLSYFLVSGMKNFLSIPFRPHTLDNLRELLIKNTRVPKENIFLAITSTHWNHAFLEIYRCIENIYLIPQARSLKNRISYKGRAAELAQECIKLLSWRKKEQHSLKLIIEDSINYDSTLFEKISWSLLMNDISTTPEKIAEKIYSTRNSLVHYTNEKNPTFNTDEDWNDCIDIITDLTSTAYEVYDSDI